MASPPRLDTALKTEYQTLFNTCEIKSDKLAIIDSVADKIIANKGRYESVGKPLNIPWYFIALLHNMECGLRFDKHLHNGDSLLNRTVHVPAGRPVKWNPPVDWEYSATDALVYEKLHLKTDWSLPALLYLMEGFNGYGYRLYHPLVKTPYLWSYSNHYTKGKYVADSKWDSNAVSEQCGSAVILKRLQEKSAVVFDSSDTMDDAGQLHADLLKEPLPSKGEVIIDKLNIRADAGAKFDTIALPLVKGSNVEILEEKDGWYKVNAKIQGWVSKTYINTKT